MTAADEWAEAARKVELWIKCGMPDQSDNTPTRDALKRDILKLIEAARRSTEGEGLKQAIADLTDSRTHPTADTLGFVTLRSRSADAILSALQPQAQGGE